MGYACPVCEVPHADEEHLANHLAFTAMLHSDEHEDWLDEHAPDWESMDAAGLAPLVADVVPEAELDESFEDTTHDHNHGHDHGQQSTGFDDGTVEQFGHGQETPTEEQARIIEEARELTRKMYEDDSDDTENE
jgi:hypothetical protein